MQTFFHPLRKSLAEWWVSGQGRSARFVGLYFRLPILLIAGAFALEKFVYYAALPLDSILEGKADYLIARIHVARGNDQAALTSIRAALLHTRDDPSFWELSAEISSRLCSPEATYCWQQLDQLRPGSFSTQMSVAQSALRNRQLDSAAAALNEVLPDCRSRFLYLQTAGELADASGELQRAREYFSRLETEHPIDSHTLLVLAHWHAESADPAELNQARVQFLKLVSRPDCATEALRALVALALKVGHPLEAARWSDDLLRSGHASFADRLQRLDILPRSACGAALAELLASADRRDVAPLAEWMMAHGRAREALAWIQGRPPDVQIDPEVRCARDDCFSALRLWEQLRHAQLSETWWGFELERLMYLSRADAETGRDVEARAAWSQAILICRDYPDYLKLLDYLQVNSPAAPSFFRSEARIRILTQMVARYPREAWIVRALLQDALARHDSLEAADCWAQLAAIEPGDVEAAANAARISLLRGSRVEKASALLQHLGAQSPENPAVITAAAYDLYRQGRFGDALMLFGELAPADLAAPERAPYLGALLAAAGPLEEAAKHVQIALGLPGLLPEEHALAERSAQLLNYRRGMVSLLRPQASALKLAANDFPALILSANQVPAIYLVGQSVALSRAAQPEEAARVLSGIDPTMLDSAALGIYLGGVLDLAGQKNEALPYLELSADLAVQTAAVDFHRAVELWWKMQGGPGVDSSLLAGLLAAYRGLDRYESDQAFWRSDQARELGLIRHALLRNCQVGAVQERLHGLLARVPSTPEMQELDAYALLLQGQPRAARDRMNVLAPAELARAEPSLYYGVILAACGEKQDARDHLRRALQAGLPSDEIELALRAERMP